MIAYDQHLHTHCSHDSKESFDAICLAARARELSGVAITDHADLFGVDPAETRDRIARSVREATEARERYPDLSISRGVEIGDYFASPDGGRSVLSLADFDLVIGSVHCLSFGRLNDAYSRCDFGDAWSDEEIEGLFSHYLSLLLTMVETNDFDVLAHLTCPLRYLVGKYRRKVDLSRRHDVIAAILSAVIRRGAALEVNTSGLTDDVPGGIMMPDESILSLYRDLGGKRIAFGSDAHIAARVGAGFREAEKRVASLGFTGYTVYRKREPIEVPF